MGARPRALGLSSDGDGRERRTSRAPDPHADAAWKVGTRSSCPVMHGIIMSGTRWKFSTRCTADDVTRSFWS